MFTSSLLISEEGEVDDKGEEFLRSRKGWNPGHRSWISLRHQEGRMEECL